MVTRQLKENISLTSENLNLDIEYSFKNLIYENKTPTSKMELTFQ